PPLYSSLSPYTALFRSERVQSRSGLDGSFVRCDGGVAEVMASTLPRQEHAAALATLRPHTRGVQRMRPSDGTGDLLVLLSPFLPDRKSTRLNSSHVNIS